MLCTEYNIETYAARALGSQIILLSGHRYLSVLSLLLLIRDLTMG
jgi:hypothetical protein